MKILLTALAALFGAATHASPIVLYKGEASFDIAQAQMGPDGILCLAGQKFDAEGDMRNHGVIILVDTAANRILWQRTVRAPDGFEGNRFIACRTDGRVTYAAADVDTSTLQSRNNGMAYVFRFDAAGKLTNQTSLATATDNAYVYDIDSDANGVSVIGMARNREGRRETNAIFLATLDPSLKPVAMHKLATGAYEWGAQARLTNRTALVGGNFAPAVLPQGELADDYAVSRIVAGKYSFSVRPQRGSKSDIATAISSAGEIVSLGVVGKASRLTVVGADGKVRVDVPVRSALCKTGSLAASATTVYAVRAPCGTADEPAKLVAIDRVSGSETAVAGTVGVPASVFAVSDRVLVVTEKKDGTVLLSSVLPGAAGAAEASSGTLDMTRHDGAVTRALSVSNWQVDKRGVPSFDFRFSQSGGGCDYQRSGHAVAGFDEYAGKAELEIYRGQDDRGRESPPMMILYAYDNTVIFSAPVRRDKAFWMSFSDTQMRKVLPKTCGGTERGSSFMFRK